MRGKQLKAELKQGGRVFGTAVLSTSPVWITVVADMGLDFVFIDTEHTPIDRTQLSWMCHAFKLSGIAPVVRIPSPCPYEASKALDAGADGIVAPYVESVSEIKALVGAVKYRPLKGKKLEGFLSGQENFSQELNHYLDVTNENHLLLINLESTPALNEITELLSVPGLDGVLVGPKDLSCSLGIPENYDHPLFVETVEMILSEARSRNLGAGVHMFYPSGYAQEMEWSKGKANILLHSSDIGSFKHSIASGLNQLRQTF